MWRDLRYAAQTLARTPAFTASAILALGLAIGANATIFSLVDGLWFRPPGVQRPGEMVHIFSTTQASDEELWSYPEYLALRDGARALSGVVACGRRGAMMAGPDGSAELLTVNVVSTNFFTTFGVRAAVGRLFAPGDTASPVVVLGHAFWTRRFGGDPTVVGSTVNLGRGESMPVTVAGILSEEFRDLYAAADRDLWVPPETWIQLAGKDARLQEFEARDSRWFHLFGRRAPGAPLASVRAEISAMAASFAQDFPGTNAGRGARVVSDFDHRVEDGGVNALALFGLVLLVVLITCVNIANLLLARAAARSREYAVRVAIGASRWRLARLLMAESALLGVLGTLAGLTLAIWLVRLLPVLLQAPPGFRSSLLFAVDARVAVFTIIVTLVTTFLFGVAPAWTASRSEVAPVIKGDAGAHSRGRAALLGRALVVCQIAVSLALLSATAVLARSFMQTGRADIGITRGPVLTAWIAFGDAPAPLREQAMRELASLPGVRSVAIAIRAPLSLSGGGRAQPVFIPQRPPDPSTGLPDVKYNAVSAGYFDVMGTRLLRGRLFSREDERGGEPVMVVSAQFEKEFFGEGAALGETVRLGGRDGTDHRVAGVVQDAVIGTIGERTEPYFYVPFVEGRTGEMTFLIGTGGDAASLGPAVRGTLARLHPEFEPRRIVTMAKYIEYSARNYRATAVLAMALGVVGLTLTALGVYGVIAYRTALRSREIGVRIALGATRGDVLRLIFGAGLLLAGLGVGIGIPVALASTRLIGSLLFGTSPWDPAAFAVAAGVLVAVVLAATTVPAWRATRLSAASALRDS